MSVILWLSSRCRRCSTSICRKLTELAISITTSSEISRRSLAAGAPLGPRLVERCGRRLAPCGMVVVVVDILAAGRPHVRDDHDHAGPAPVATAVATAAIIAATTA